MPSENLKKSPLQILFTQEERESLRSISQRDGREEGPEIKWLLRQYADGNLIDGKYLKQMQQMHEELVKSLDQLRELRKSLENGTAHFTSKPPQDLSGNPSSEEDEEEDSGEYPEVQVIDTRRRKKKTLPARRKSA